MGDLRYLYDAVKDIDDTQVLKFARLYLNLEENKIKYIQADNPTNAENKKFEMVAAWANATDGAPREKEEKLRQLTRDCLRSALVHSDDLPTSAQQAASPSTRGGSDNSTGKGQSAPNPASFINISGNASTVSFTGVNMSTGSHANNTVNVGMSEKQKHSEQGPTEAKRQRLDVPGKRGSGTPAQNLDQPGTSTQHEPGAQTADDLDEVILSTEEQYEKHCEKISKKAGKEYSMVVGEGEEKGCVLIINNKFGGEKVRECSDEDVRSQKTLWKEIGCKVFPRFDLDATEMLDEIKLFTRRVEKVKICVVVIMTHGGIKDGKDILWGHSPTGNTGGGYMTVDTVLEQFSDSACPQLAGIPKLIIFQACRGLKVKGVTGADGLTLDDMFVAYATQPDHRAFRECVGSWFIKSITEVLNMNAHDTDVETMFKKVKEKVSRKIAYNPGNPEIHGGKQEVDYENNLGRKKLFLYPGWPKSSK